VLSSIAAASTVALICYPYLEFSYFIYERTL